MATTTVNDLLKLCLKDAGIVGIGQTPKDEDINDAFDRVNMMLAQWQVKRWLVYHLIDLSKVSTGQQFYTVGAGGDLDPGYRVNSIESAYMRQLNTTPSAVDYPMDVIKSFEDYSRIRLKSLTAFSRYYFYDSGYPLGKVYPWPIMQSGIYELHIQVKALLAGFTSLAQTITLPPEYKAAIFYNLACRLRPAYQMEPDPSLVALAKDALDTVRTANTQIPTMRMPDGLAGRGNYSVYSDLSN